MEHSFPDQKKEGKEKEMDEKTLKIILDSLEDEIILIDKDFRIVEVNSSFLEKRKLSKNQVIGKLCHQIFHNLSSPCEFPDEICPVKEVLKKNQRVKTIHLRKEENGAERYTEITSCPVKNEKGELVNLFSTLQDLTSIEKIEKELKESEEKYKNLIEKAHDAIVVIQDDKIKIFNQRLLDLVGCSPENLEGLNFWEGIVPEYREMVIDRYRRRQKGENPPDHYEIEILTKNQEVKKAELSVTLIDYQGKPAHYCFIRDITEKKRAEEEIKYLKEFNEEIVEQLPIGVMRLDAEGKIIYENPRMAEILGVKKGEKSVALGQKITQMPNVQNTGLFDYLNDLLSGKPFRKAVCHFTSLYQKEAILSANGLPLYNKNNQVNGALLFIEDMTETKKKEEEIYRRNKELSALNTIANATSQSLDMSLCLKNTLDKVMEIMESESGGIYLLNGRKAELSLREARGLFLDKISKKLKIGEGICGEIVNSGRAKRIEVETGSGISLITPEHSPQIKIEGPLSFIGVPIKSKNKVFGTIFVLTQKNRKQANQKLELLTSIGNQVGVAVENAQLFKEAEKWISQLETVQKITNRLNKLNSVKEIAASLAEEIRKVIEFDNCRVFLIDEKREALLPVAFGSELEEYQGETEELLRMKVGEGITGWVAQSGEGRLVDDVEKHPKSRHIPGSTYIDESMIASPMIYEGKVRGVITLSKLGLRQFQPSDLGLLSILANEAIVAVENARLLEDLNHAYSKLKNAQEQLIQSEKLNALGEMAGGVAHDFNNVLGAILGRAQLLQMEASDPKIRKGLKSIEQAALDGAETVRRIQEFTRVRTDESFLTADINQLIKQSLEQTKPKWKDQAQKNGIEIEVFCNLEESLPPIAGNPSELKETFTNIILNAIDAMPQGGKLTISTQRGDRFVLVSFADTGCGMSEEVKRKVFDPFFTTKGPKGTGLGLSVAYGIVIRHGGKIDLETQEGKGATFFVQFPIREMAELAPKIYKIETPKEKVRVLVIDDEPAILDLLCEILRAHDQETEGVTSGKEGIAKFKEGRFDLVFTDLSMPEMSGWEVITNLKEIDPQAIMVLITGWGTQIEPEKLKEGGVDLMVGKPFSVSKVMETVSQALELKKKGEKKEETVI
jgi:PAS domain S-box-containing protein